MDALTGYAVYMTGVVALVGLYAARVPHENARTVFLLAFLWPLSLLAIAIMLLLTATGWNMDMAKGTKCFGYRRGTNPLARGIAVTIFFQEFQFYTIKGQ